MVALTYDVRTVRIPVPRLVLRSGRDRLHRARRPAREVPHWVRSELHSTERRLEADRLSAIATRMGAGL